ncbi:MAG: ArnT family glycosyltransferase, partial [Anaerolineales bacterium]
MGRIRFRNDIYKQAALISIIILFAFVLRFVNLGYSNYQREETRAMFLKGKNQSSIEFLLDQRKGPAQFLVSRVVQVINPSYQNQFISRLPFAAASFLSVIFFFLFVKNLYNDLIAFFSTFFFVTNGIIVGLSRIVQYQSLVFFFTTLTLASLVFALKKPKFHVWGLYIGMVSWALALLSHYDGIFIAPMV